MSAHENATPIRILHNAAGHLAGPARSLGAVLMGYLGMKHLQLSLSLTVWSRFYWITEPTVFYIASSRGNTVARMLTS